MTRTQLARTFCGFVLLAAVWGSACAAARGEETALDRYIATPDPEFRWTLVRTVELPDASVHVLELVSQTWRSADEVDRPQWTHWLTVVRPHRVVSRTAFLYIGGGSNNDAAPDEPSSRTLDLARATGTVVAELGMVPNQPLHFSDAPNVGRSEDDLVAYSRMRFIATGDPTWLVRLAMVKSGVRAMDAISQFLDSDAGGKTKVDEFVVAGGSKRGWTTWLVGTVDPRVRAIIPLVIDALNTESVTRHHLAAYGFYSPALNDYVRHKLYPDQVGTPAFREILRIEDPYSYRDRERLRIPKYVVNSAGDQFFLPDNSQFYYHDLPEEKHLRYIPNTKHSLTGSDVRESILAYYQSILANQPRPKYSWKKESGGSLIVTAQDVPREVRLWQATNAEARDFRLDTIGPAYTSQVLNAESPGIYRAHVEPPAKGFTAFFVELTYDLGGAGGLGPLPIKFTTDVVVVPDILPFAKKAERP